MRCALFGPDARQRAQRFDQCRQGGRMLHRAVRALQNGSFMPGGSDMPPIAAAIFACEAPRPDAPHR